jgi:hypothetical protein
MPVPIDSAEDDGEREMQEFSHVQHPAHALTVAFVPEIELTRARVHRHGA